MLAHRCESSVDWAKRAIGLAEQYADNEILSHAFNNLGTARIVAGDDAGWIDLERSLNLALQGRMQEHVARAYTNLSSTAAARRRYSDAFRYLADGIDYCEKHDLDSWRLYMLAWRARAHFEQGRWNEAGEDATAVLRQPRIAPISRVPALTVLARLRVRRGDPEAILPLKEAMLLAQSTQELQRIGPVAAAWAEYSRMTEDWRDSLDYIRAAYALTGLQRDPWIKGELAAALRCAAALDVNPLDIAEPYALEMSGDWRGAARAWKDLGCPYEHASLAAQHGSEAEQREALALLERLGASPAVQALRKRMRMNGVRGLPRGARATTRSNPYNLTQREVQVLSLVTDGLSNATIAKRLYLSTRTVDHHVSAILSKLGAQSRAQAIALAQRPAPLAGSED